MVCGSCHSFVVGSFSRLNSITRFALLNRLTPLQPEGSALRVSSDGFCLIVSIVKAQSHARRFFINPRVTTCRAPKKKAGHNWPAFFISLFTTPQRPACRRQALSFPPPTPGRSEAEESLFASTPRIMRCESRLPHACADRLADPPRKSSSTKPGHFTMLKTVWPGA